MQVFIAKLLNVILVVTFVVIVLLFAGIFVIDRFSPEYKNLYIGGFVLSSIGMSIAFKRFENSWDKNLVMKMAREGKIALVNIESANPVMPLRDTNFISYLIYEFQGTLYNGEHSPLKKTFYEKINRAVKEIPPGSVYVTYDPVKPKRIFIIPNALIGSLQNLAPIAASYEKNPSLNIKYLDVHYNKGMVIQNFEDTVKEYRKESNEEDKK